MSRLEPIRPDWPAPTRVRALSTTRAGGVSGAPYADLNLATHVGDRPAAVRENRARLREGLQLPSEPLWLTQVHGTRVADAEHAGEAAEADASVTRRPGTVCAVLTADCLPVLLCDRQGRSVAAAHAGWRGLAAGVVEAAVRRVEARPEDLMAWLGPAIGPRAFEVGAEVREAFAADHPRTLEAFVPSREGRWLADLYRLARLRLARLGVHAVYGGQWCTYSDPSRFYSYRRAPRTGRMASLIWIAP